MNTTKQLASAAVHDLKEALAQRDELAEALRVAADVLDVAGANATAESCRAILAKLNPQEDSR